MRTASSPERCSVTASVVAIFACLLGACTTQTNESALKVQRGIATGASVVLITMDTTRADHLGCYGMQPSVTPVLDRLCADAIRFSNAVTPAPITLPAHAAILSGLLPPNHGARYNGEFQVGPDIPSLAAELKAAGYDTAAFVSAFVLDHRFGLDRGFDTYDDHVVAASRRHGFVRHNERDAALTTDAALEFLAHQGGTKPFFLWVHYFDPHAPYVPRDPSSMSSAGAAYSAEIADMDAQIGRLLESPAIDPDRSVVVATADHGEGLGDHGETSHGVFVYESTTQVPLLVRLPGRHLGGEVNSTLASLIDIRPTLLDLLGLQPADRSDGISLIATRRGPDDSIYQEATLPYFDFGFAPVHGLRAQSSRFIEGAQPEYYDLENDPGERDNRYPALAGTDDNPADKLQQRLDARMLGMTDVPTAAKDSRSNDAATLAKLQSLGYLAEGAPVAGGTLPDAREKLEVINLHRDAASLLEGQHWSQALSLLDRADSMSPDNPSILRLKSKAELLSNQIPAAEQTLRRMLAQRRSADSLVLLAQIQILHKDIAGATALLDEAAKLEPTHGGIFIARGDIAAGERRPEKALALYRQALENDAVRTGAIARGRIAEINAQGAESDDSGIRETPTPPDE